MSRPVLWAHRNVPADVLGKLARVLGAAHGDRLPWRGLPTHQIPHLPADCVYVVDAASLEPVDEDADRKA